MMASVDRKLVLPVVLLGLIGFLSGCGKHQGRLGWIEEASEPSVNYRVVKSVTGEASSTSFFGFGEPNWNLYDRARQKLVEQADLEPGQRLINRTLDEKVEGFPPTIEGDILLPFLNVFQVYYKKTVFLSGEVVEITEE